MSEILFQKNCEKWAETDPRKAYMLPFFSPGAKGQKKRRKSNVGLKKEDLKEVDVLFIFGLDEGFSYDKLKEWVKKNRLVILEDDLGAIYHFFQGPLAEELLRDKNVTLLHFDTIEEAKEKMLILRWEFLFKKIKTIASSSYEKTKKETYENLYHRIENDQALHNSLVKEYLECGSVFFKNFYENLKELPGSYLGTALFHKFKNIPAIICGAGPSLNLHLKALKKVEKRALIFAGGSSFNALTSAGVTPHFGAGIDPNEAQKERIKETCHVKVPFFFRNRLNPEALKLIKGERLYIPGSGGFDVSEWFEKKLKIPREEVLDEGHNVINFEVEIAHALGCYPIIFLGMDLAYTGMRSYAEGIVEEVAVTKSKILRKQKEDKNKQDFDLKAVLKKDIYGKPLYTLWKWIIEAEWMGHFAKEHPKALLINATEGGLGMPGIKNETFKAVQKKYFLKEFPLREKIKREIKKSALLQVTTKKVTALKKTLARSLKKSLLDLDGLLEEIETMKKKIQELKKVEKGMNLVSGRSALFESDLAEEEAFPAVLQVFSEVFAYLLSHELKNVRLSKLSEKKKALKKLELNAMRLNFLKGVADVNLQLLEMTK